MARSRASRFRATFASSPAGRCRRPGPQGRPKRRSHPGTGGCEPSGGSSHARWAVPPRWRRVVTGGSGAIGAAVCGGSRAHGANVALTYHSRRDAADAWSSRGGAAWGGSPPRAVDLADSEAANNSLTRSGSGSGPFTRSSTQPGRMCHRYTSVGLHRRSSAARSTRRWARSSTSCIRCCRRCVDRGTIVAVTTVAIRLPDPRSGCGPGPRERRVARPGAGGGGGPLRRPCQLRRYLGSSATDCRAHLLRAARWTSVNLAAATSRIPLRRSVPPTGRGGRCVPRLPLADYVTGQDGRRRRWPHSVLSLTRRDRGVHAADRPPGQAVLHVRQKLYQWS